MTIEELTELRNSSDIRSQLDEAIALVRRHDELSCDYTNGGGGQYRTTLVEHNRKLIALVYAALSRSQVDTANELVTEDDAERAVYE